MDAQVIQIDGKRKINLISNIMKIKIIQHKGKFLIKKGATYYNDAYNTLEEAQGIVDKLNFYQSLQQNTKNGKSTL